MPIKVLRNLWESCAVSSVFLFCIWVCIEHNQHLQSSKLFFYMSLWYALGFYLTKGSIRSYVDDYSVTHSTLWARKRNSVLIAFDHTQSSCWESRIRWSNRLGSLECALRILKWWVSDRKMQAKEAICTLDQHKLVCILISVSRLSCRLVWINSIYKRIHLCQYNLEHLCSLNEYLPLNLLIEWIPWKVLIWRKENNDFICFGIAICAHSTLHYFILWNNAFEARAELVTYILHF